MSETVQELFELSPKLDMLTPCEMMLSSPIENGILQVETYKPKEFIGLLLVKDSTGIHLSRQDHEDIQIEVNTWDPYNGESKVKVFDSPLPSLEFEKVGTGRKGKIWRLGQESSLVSDREALKSFTSILGKYALLKQARDMFAPVIASLSSSK